MASIRLIALGCVIISLLGCEKEMTPEKYIKCIDDHRDRISESVKRNGIVARVSSIPAEYYAAQDMCTRKMNYNQAMDKYSKAIYLTISISSDHKQSGSVLLEKNGLNGFSENIYLNTFKRYEDIFLLKGKDTIKATNIEYERNWGIGNEDVFLAAFPREEARGQIKQFHLIVRDLLSELGTVDVALKEIMISPGKLKG